MRTVTVNEIVTCDLCGNVVDGNGPLGIRADVRLRLESARAYGNPKLFEGDQDLCEDCLMKTFGPLVRKLLGRAV